MARYNLTKHKEIFYTDLRKTYGLNKDRFGHVKFSGNDGNVYRFKVQHQTVRAEVKTSHGWVRLDSFGFEHIEITLKYISLFIRTRA